MKRLDYSKINSHGRMLFCFKVSSKSQDQVAMVKHSLLEKLLQLMDKVDVSEKSTHDLVFSEATKAKLYALALTRRET